MSKEGYIFPLSYAQQRLWFMDQLVPRNPFYNLPSSLRMMGPFNRNALARSINDIVRRHESLRTVFEAEGGKPYQLILPELEIELPVFDLRHLPDEERERRARELVSEEAKRPFDLSEGPLLRTTLLKLDDEEHVLVINMHHVVSDAWSISLFTAELTELYESYLSGSEPSLPELPIQYADFAQWQRKWLEGGMLAKQLAYWKGQLEGAPEVLFLPTDRPRPAMQSYRGAYRTFSLSRDLSDSILALTRQERCTLFITLLAAFKTLIYRYTGCTDVVIGAPIANRTRAEIESLIGFFINTLVMRTDLSGNPTFREVMGRVKEVALGAYANQDVPFEKLVEELHPEREASRNPLVQVVFTLQNAPMQIFDLAGLDIRSMEVESGATRFDLALHMREQPAGIESGMTGTLLYSMDLFDEQRITRMVDHLQNILEGIVANPDYRIRDLALLSDAELARVLVEWNETEMPYPRQRCIHELIDEQAFSIPDAVAVRCGDRWITYGELETRADRLAARLQSRGVGPESLVGIVDDRSIGMVIGLVGILKAGAGYVPLDPAYPSERLSFLVRDAGIEVVVSDGGGIDLAGVDTVDAVGREEQSADTGGDAGPVSGNVAYVIYTSGTTGEPKGVVVEHGSVVNYLWWVGKELCGGDVRMPVVSSLTFDASVKQLLGPLVNGGPVWVVGDRGVEAMEEIFAEDGVWLNCVPSLWRVVVGSIRRTEKAVASGSIARLLLGGERFDGDLVRETQEIFPGIDIWNLYGPTEGTVNVSAGRVASGEVVTMGRPVGNVRVYILDGEMRPVPVGVEGELYIGGRGVSRGYRGRPGLTAERYVPDPFGDEGGRLYRTGDRIRYCEDGELLYAGRVDDQVKMRGYRIEPGEVEAVLAGHPTVREIAVAVHGDQTGQGTLAAYIVTDGNRDISTDELSLYLGGKLPTYMVPSIYIRVDAVPHTGSGKVDRAALPRPGTERSELMGVYAHPRTALETVLAGLWAELLHLDRVGIHDNFFTELGGHSLLATQLRSRIRDTLGVDAPLQRFFEAPTVASFAEALADDEAERSRIERTAEHLIRLERMTDEEVERMFTTRNTSTRRDEQG